jgi:hypothetical protein
MAVGVGPKKVAKSLDGNDGARDGIPFRHRLQQKELQGFPGAAAQIREKIPVIQKIPKRDFRDGEDEMPVRNLLEHVGTEPFPEFHHPLLMAGGTEMASLAGEGQKIFMVAIPALRPGKAVVQVTPFQVALNDLLEVGSPEPVRLRRFSLRKGGPASAWLAANQIAGSNVALLVDTILREEGKPQRFGTQFKIRKGKAVIDPVEGPAYLDERRAQYGLSSVAEFKYVISQLYRVNVE